MTYEQVLCCCTENNTQTALQQCIILSRLSYIPTRTLRFSCLILVHGMHLSHGTADSLTHSRWNHSYCAWLAVITNRFTTFTLFAEHTTNIISLPVFLGRLNSFGRMHLVRWVSSGVIRPICNSSSIQIKGAASHHKQLQLTLIANNPRLCFSLY